MLQLLLVTLREPSNEVNAKFFSREVLEQKGARPGWVQMSMAKYPVTRQLLNLVANVPSSQGTAVHEAKETIRLKLASPLQYSETFHSQNVAVEDVEVPDGKEGEDDVVWVSSGNDLSVICEGMPKSMFAFAELLHNVYPRRSLLSTRSPRGRTRSRRRVARLDDHGDPVRRPHPGGGPPKRLCDDPPMIGTRT